jgi:peptidoglycan/LPS O-acetylase OafA/YrhL
MIAIRAGSLPSGAVRPAEAGRAEDIDTIRAIACIALVSFHVVGVGPTSGLELGRDHWLSVMNAALIDLRMPLFSFVSGYVFTQAWPGQGKGRERAPWGRIAAKARRLLLPMACVGTLFWLARDAAGIAQQPFATIFVTSFAHYWFLQATFLIMAAFLLATWAAGGRGGAVAAVLMAAAVAVWLLQLRPAGNLFSMRPAVHLAIFFMAGHLLARAGATASLTERRGRRLGIAAVAASVALGACLATGAVEVQAIWLRQAIGGALGLAFCVALFAARPRSASLAHLGRHSYAIYLFHVFFTAATILAVRHLAPGLDAAAVWPVATAAGLAGPMVLQTAILRVPAAALLLLGVRARQARPGPTAPRPVAERPPVAVRAGRAHPALN